MARASVVPARHQPERPLWTAILRLLEERASHGYELVGRLGEAGTRSASAPADAVSVYRALRAMEAAGIVSSTWDVSQRGARPAGLRPDTRRPGGRHRLTPADQAVGIG